MTRDLWVMSRVNKWVSFWSHWSHLSTDKTDKLMNNVAICGGCNQKKAIVARYPGMGNIQVCLDCQLRIQSDLRAQEVHYANQRNSLISEMEHAVGLPRGTAEGHRSDSMARLLQLARVLKT